jgi:Na+-driven multidrug efflux pump
MQPILGFNFGANKWDRVKRTLYIGISLGASVTIIGFILTETLPDTISKLFTTDQTLIDIARNGFRIYFSCYPVVGCQIVIQNFFQSIGKPKLSIFLSLTRQLLFLIPFLIILPRYYGTNGVWASMCGSDVIAFIVSGITLIFMIRHLNKHFASIKPIN